MLSRFIVPLACATFLVAGCGGNAQEPAAKTRLAQQSGGGSRQITLKGCVGTAPGTNQYVLQHVHLEPIPEQASDVQSAPGTAITEGSWVKLRMGDDDPLRANMGKVVSLRGTVIDDGLSTIGTGGQPAGPGERGARADQSRAAANEHYSGKVAKEAGPIGQQSLANGTAPEIAVESVVATGERCPR
jgi:hypothetical protein